MRGTDGGAEGIDRVFANATEQRRFAGTVAFSRRGQRSFSKAYGYADALGEVSFTSGTVSQIASVSKQFTAAAVLLLAESGDLSIDDPISRWVRTAPEHWEPVRVHHLLSHTSGLPHWRDLPQLDLFRPMSDAEIVAAFASRPLKFSPGAGWAYSSPGYHLLARAVEAASGQPYGAFVRDRIFAPLGMRHTFVGSHWAAGVPRAEGFSEAGAVPSFDLDSTGRGAGDAWSTADDLLRWDHGLAGPAGLLSPGSLDESFRPHGWIPSEHVSNIPQLNDLAYGYAWYLGTIRGSAVRFHSGDNPGFRALNVWVPDAGLQFAFCSNLEATETLPLALSVLGQLLETA